jgi:hypothetical protein
VEPYTASGFEIPTPYESAVLARRILALTPLAVFSTVFPKAHAEEHRPDGLNLEGVPIGLVDYVADCEGTGNPTVLALSIGTTFKNAAAGSNVSVSYQWTPPHKPAKRIESSSKDRKKHAHPHSLPYSAANLPRFSVSGHLEKITDEEAEEKGIVKCYTAVHPDAKYWLPGNKIHHAEWARLVVDSVYWIGGFGDRAYIGWLDLEDFKNITREEWEAVELPGERKGWKEW